MAKQIEGKKTIDLLDGEKRGRGRPPKENALTNSERQRLFRERRKKLGFKPVLVWMPEKAKKVSQVVSQSSGGSRAKGKVKTKIISEAEWPYPEDEFGTRRSRLP